MGVKISIKHLGIEWSNVSRDKMTSNDLILTIGNLSSTAIECGVEEMNEVGTVTEVETGRKGRFFEIRGQNFIWASFPKSFDASSMNEMAKTICEMNFKSILILEAQASQVAGIRPGIYQISIGKQQNLPKLPSGFAAQGKLTKHSEFLQQNFGLYSTVELLPHIL